MVESRTTTESHPGAGGQRVVFRREADLGYRNDRRMRWLSGYFAVLAAALAAVLLSRTADRAWFDWLGIVSGAVFAPVFAYMALLVFGRPFCLVEVDETGIRFGGRGTRLLDRRFVWDTDRLRLTVHIASGPEAEAGARPRPNSWAWFSGFLQPRFPLSTEAAELILDALRSHGASIGQDSYNYGPRYHVDAYRIQLPAARVSA